MTKISKPKIIVILGPTACGKTKIAVRMAKQFNGEIISADSRQVYEGMDIGTGKDLKEYTIRESRIANHKTKIPYHLINVLSPKKQFSLAIYQKLAYQAIDSVLKRKKVPFLVGGTGLYLQSIIDGYQLVNIKPDKKLREQLYKKELKQLQGLTLKLKIKLNQSDFNNKRRLIRVIEKVKGDTRYPGLAPRPARHACGSQAGASGAGAIHDTRLAKYDCLILGIKYPRQIINKRIDQRLRHRLEKENMIGEVKKLRRLGLSWKQLEDFGLEYKWIALYLQKKTSYNEMMEKLKIAIHQFAKRQMTWFSAHGGSASGGKRMKNIHWINNSNKIKILINKFIK